MRRSKKSKPTTSPCDQNSALVGMIDYLLPEVRSAGPLAEYFMRMARAAIVESARSGIGR
jgi:hypothetical protein